MPFMTSTPLEERGADIDNVVEVSIQGVRSSDIFVGIFGRRYSDTTVQEAREAIKTKKLGLMYVKRVANRDQRLSEFIDKELSAEFKYDRFSRNKDLIPKVQHDLDSQLSRILTEGLKTMQERKKTAIRIEKQVGSELASIPPAIQDYRGLLSKAQNDYNQGLYMESVMVSSTAIEVALRDLLRKRMPSNSERIRTSSLGSLIDLAQRAALLSSSMASRLLFLAQNRNEVLHQGSTPTREEVETTLRLAKTILEALTKINDKES
jgi:HEPN domain-containing protein